MNDPADSTVRAPEPVREPPTMPASRQSIKYGKAPIDENSSGRRARLRHPARGTARN